MAPTNNNPLKISHFTFSSAIGLGKKESLNALQSHTTGLIPNNFPEASTLQTFIGRVDGIEEKALSDDYREFDCRNNRLAELALQQDQFDKRIRELVDCYGTDRIGVFMGTSTSGIQETEKAYSEIDLTTPDQSLPDWYSYQNTHNVYSLPHYICRKYGITGISEIISTACSSSAKVFASAARAIELGLCDTAIVGGVDSLCLTTLYGFNSLQLVSNDISKPSSAERDGLSLGEAAGFAILEKPTESDNSDTIYLKGFGESCDAYHMSSPCPDGNGALRAMKLAIERAQLDANDIDYINLHGTGTPANDLAESNAVVQLFNNVPASSTKGWTGHTLGAAGIIETAICCLALENNFAPKTLNTETVDPEIKANILTQPLSQSLKNVMTNSFGFGGNNCSLVLGFNDGQ